MNFIPTVVTKQAGTDRVADIYSVLLGQRIVMLQSEFEDGMASSICSQLLYLDSQSNDEIQMYINSPGGQVTSAMAIYDTMQYIKSPVRTIVMGMAASAGSLILSAGTAGRRCALPNAKIMLHQPSSGQPRGTVTDLEIHMRDLLRTKRQLNEVYVKHTGKDYNTIENALERDNYMTPQEALDFGVIDEIIDTK